MSDDSPLPEPCDTRLYTCTLGAAVLAQALDPVPDNPRPGTRVLKTGARLISISGPPDPAFGDDIAAPWFVKPILRAGSASTRRRAERLEVDYSFLFIRANGRQLTEITSLIDAGIIRPILDRVSPFASTNDAIAYVDSGRAKGKVVVTVR